MFHMQSTQYGQQNY